MHSIILNKVRSNHSNLADKYKGVCVSLPTVGERFIMLNGMDERITTTPVLVSVRLSANVIEFETKNSKYSLELENATL